MARRPVAPQLLALLESALGQPPGSIALRVSAWDGSEAGPSDAPVVRVRTPRALRRLLWAPSELGLARAYVSGDLDVEGDPSAAVGAYAAATAGRSPTEGQGRRRRDIVTTALRLGVLGPPPAPPAEEVRPLRGRRHTRSRDRQAVGHHYDVGNDFYRLVLGPTLVYSCAYWTRPGDPAYTLEDAQRDKLDLVCRKLGLGEGTTVLDVGCGWGSLSLHAAEHFGARVTGVTIAAEQKAFIDARVAERGLQDRVDIRLQDYRDVAGTFDAVASIEMGEHVGEVTYPTYAEVLHDRVRPGGRVLVQQMSRPGKGGGRHPGGGPFIESFIAPDMHMRPVGETVAHLEAGGLEVRDVHALREHYVRTVAGWLERFEAAVPRLTSLVGEEQVRVWRLYLVGGAMAFRDGRMGVDQILMVRPGAAHTLAPVRAW